MSNSSSLYKNLMLEAKNKNNKAMKESLLELKRMYERTAKDIINRTQTAKGGFTQAWLKDYEKYLKFRLDKLNRDIESLVNESIITSGKFGAEAEGEFLQYLNGKYELDVPKEDLRGFYNISDDVLLKIMNGELYRDNKGISNRIWGYGERNLKNIQYIVNEGIISGKSYLEILKDLEKYVDPSAKKPWDFGKVYPGLKEYKVDYNSQRLLRTTMNHMFYIAAMEKVKRNPYVEGVKWILSGQHSERQVKRFGEDECDEYAAKEYFKKDEVPLPHPQCLCTQVAHIPKSLDEIGQDLNKWINGATNKELDKWFKGE